MEEATKQRLPNTEDLKISTGIHDRVQVIFDDTTITMKDIRVLRQRLKEIKQRLCEIEKQRLRKIGDLKILSGINETISEMLGDTTTIAIQIKVEDMRKLGHRFKEIAWQQKDKECVRNKHGHRSRFEKGGKQLNQQGAGIDFESLSRWIDFPESPEYQALFDEYQPKLRLELRVLQDKVCFVLEKERSCFGEKVPAWIPENHGGDAHLDLMGCAVSLATFSYDTLLINQLIVGLKEFDALEKLDLSERVCRYYLGYYFTLMGEIAKDISDFLKPEPHKTNQKKNEVRFLLTRLGKYRQAIKNSPWIVRSDNIMLLSNMRTQFMRVLPDLLAFFELLSKEMHAQITKLNIDLYEKQELNTLELYQEEKHMGLPAVSSYLAVGVMRKPEELQKRLKSEADPDVKEMVHALLEQWKLLSSDTSKPDESTLSRTLGEIEFIQWVFEQINVIGSRHDLLLRQYWFAVKMSFAFLGEYYQDLMADPKKSPLPRYPVHHSILYGDLVKAALVRHKHVSHDMLHCDDSLVCKTMVEKVLPWKSSIKSMIILSADHSGSLSDFPSMVSDDSRLSFDYSSLDEEDKQLYREYVKIRARNFLLESPETITVLYSKLKITNRTSPDLAAELLFQKAVAHYNDADNDAALECFDKFMECIDRVDDGHEKRFKTMRAHCDMATIHLQKDHVERAIALLQPIVDNQEDRIEAGVTLSQPIVDKEKLAGSFLLQRIVLQIEAEVMYCDALMLSESIVEGVSRMELLYAQHIELLKQEKPTLLLTLMVRLMHGYSLMFDMSALEDLYAVYNTLMSEIFPKVINGIGQSAQYFQLMGISVIARLRLFNAVRDKNDHFSEVFEFLHAEKMRRCERGFPRVWDSASSFQMEYIMSAVFSGKDFEAREAAKQLTPADEEAKEDKVLFQMISAHIKDLRYYAFEFEVMKNTRHHHFLLPHKRNVIRSTLWIFKLYYLLGINALLTLDSSVLAKKYFRKAIFSMQIVLAINSELSDMLAGECFHDHLLQWLSADKHMVKDEALIAEYPKKKSFVAHCGNLFHSPEARHPLCVKKMEQIKIHESGVEFELDRITRDGFTGFWCCKKEPRPINIGSKFDSIVRL